MATLVLGAVGTLVGGPLGGALGALAGRQIDGAVFGSPAREGPRLEELKVTTSSYGQPIPRHVGRMRTAGTIVWATDLAEHGETSGGKGKPKTTSYSYSTSFAVLLASHPIDGVGRIWADGNLLRGAGGDLKTAGTLRIHTGHGDQAPDPLMAAALGNRCPAFRGCAYLVFEDLQLADFGNRIPALSYEVLAGDAARVVAVLAGDAGADCDPALTLPGIAGYTHQGGSTASSLALLDGVRPIVPLLDRELRLGGLASADAAITLGEAAVWEDGEFGPRDGQRRERSAHGQGQGQEAFAGLRYYDVERDYLPGVQRPAARPERLGQAQGSGQGQALVDFPAAASARDARALAQAMLARSDAGRTRDFVRLAELDPAIAPGALVRLPDRPGLWSVEAWEWREKGVELELRRHRDAARPIAPPASHGLPWSPPDRLPGHTLLDAFELPWDGFGASDRLLVYAALGSDGGRWAGAALYAESAGTLRPIGAGASFGTSGGASSGGSVGRAVTGTLAFPLASSPSLMIEDGPALSVNLADRDMILAPTTTAGLADGANRLLVGEELLQFRDAVQTGEHRWDLRGLLRGRGGSEPVAALGHAAGAPVVLVDERLIALEPEAVGTAGRIAAIGGAEEAAVMADIRLRGASLRPLVPVHPRRSTLPDGGLSLAWTRRARGAWRWSEALDVPLVEESERYEVGVGPVDAPLAAWHVATPQFVLSAADRAALASPVHGPSSSPGVLVWVRQIGSFARSAPLLLATLA